MNFEPGLGSEAGRGVESQRPDDVRRQTAFGHGTLYLKANPVFDLQITSGGKQSDICIAMYRLGKGIRSHTSGSHS